ncbi:hypothetical protein Ahy_B07g088702 [Arachis hypogaea]|uniref:SWIM-type domain-containing protein n=1 Tax=Arachis hypogaea TaxID=3818 RepID=A0A444YFB3_ARAHY|nr:hypothetical protein Ahy_B07g088702 [Arachis hypogaea]
MSVVFTDTEMNEQYREDDDFNQQEELVSHQDMMDEQNEFEQDFRDEYTEGAFFSESDMSDYIVQAAYAVDSVQDIPSLKFSQNFAEEIGKYHFSTLQLAFDFYMKYSKSKSFRISTSQIFGLLASQAGGYQFVGYGPRDMYNEIARQRHYEIPVFKRKWVQLIEEFGIEDKPWVINMYEEKHMWATAYLRGKFFAGFRTTSRCEGLHSFVGRYVGSRYDLTSFVEHFQRCVAHMRFNEFNADYESTRGVPVMQTCIELLERYAAELYTHEIFLFFRPILSRARSMRVLNIDNTDDCIKYIVCKHGRPDFTWTVDFRQEEMIFMCTCLRMDSFGIPCEHIVKILVDRDIREIPRSLIKSALNDPSRFTRDAVVISRQSALVEFSKQLAAIAAKVPERYEETRDLIMGLFSSYKAADEGDNQPHSGVARSSNPYVHPTTGGSGQPSKKKKRQHCSVCQMEGHKKTTCPWQKDIDNNVIENEAIGSDDGEMCTEATAELDSDKLSIPPWRTLKQRNPNPILSPPYPDPPRRRRLQFQGTLTLGISILCSPVHMVVFIASLVVVCLRRACRHCSHGHPCVLSCSSPLQLMFGSAVLVLADHVLNRVRCRVYGLSGHHLPPPFQANFELV